MASLPLRLKARKLLGGLRRLRRRSPLPKGEWFSARAVQAGFEWRFKPGALAGAAWLTADFLAGAKDAMRFVLSLAEGPGGPAFELSFRLLPQCQARMRLPLAATDQNRWGLQREGAWLKPICRGSRVELAKVDRLELRLSLKGAGPARWCMTPMIACAREPELLTDPLLPRGPLLDELGQSTTLSDWPGKSRSRRQVTRRLRKQLQDAQGGSWPAAFSRWGGWKARKVDASGFFRTHHDGRRWWLVDPGGHLFWSAGLDCLRVDADANCQGLLKALAWPGPARDGRVNYLRENLIAAFGPDDWYECWSRAGLGLLKAFGFNTVGNWSDWDVARRAGMPYVRPLAGARDFKTPRVFRDFPDVFEPSFQADAEAFARQLDQTRDDPAMVGYFLMNEPTWGFATQTPAEGMLFVTERCAARRELVGWLRRKYASDEALRNTWQMDVSFGHVGEGRWREPVSQAAGEDLAAFSTVMVDRLFSALSGACRRADRNHLNLGARYHTVPPDWAAAGMGCFDVFSVNCYRDKVRRDLEPLCEGMSCPALIGEWHFGALDVGLPAAGLMQVPDQAARGTAYRTYLEDAAAQPWCVGAHWFTLYDQSAMGRDDGENYNIGFLDICNRPYRPLAAAARRSHERLYEVASGARAPYRGAARP